MEQLHTYMDCFRHEIRENLDGVKAATISGIEKSLDGKVWKVSKIIPPS